MSAQRPEGAASRIGSWLIGAVIVGWALVYNVMRVSGSSPREAAWISLVIGGAAGIAAYAAGHLALRRLGASGRVLHRGPVEVPPPERLSAEQRDAVRLAAGALAALAAAAILIGLALAVSHFTAAPGDGSLATLMLAAWNLLAGVWVGDEALRLHRGDAEGVESVTLGCLLTAVLAGVGLSRSLIEPGQIVLIVLAGLGGAAAALVTWRLAGARGAPVGAIVAIVVAVAAIALPLLA